MDESQKGSGMKVAVWVVIAVLVVWGVYALANKTPAQKVVVETGPIKIGVMVPLTGDFAVAGEPAQNIYKLAVKEINDAGGVNGRPLELVTEDSKCNGEGGANAAQKLINVDRVQLIIGGICSGETIPAVSIAETNKVVIISPAASSPALTGMSHFFVRNYPGDSAQGKVLADIAYNKLGLKNMYILNEQTDYAQGIAKVVESTFSGLGGKVTREEFPTATTDLRQLVTKAKAANPDAFVVNTQAPATAQKIFKVMRDLKWSPKLFTNDANPGDPPTMSLYRDVLNGAYVAEIGTDPSNPIFKHALDLYKSTYNSEMPFQSYGQTEWDVLFIVRDGIKAVGYNGPKLADWLHSSVKDWQGASGSVTIGADGDPLVGHRAEVIKDGKTEVLK